MAATRSSATPVIHRIAVPLAVTAAVIMIAVTVPFSSIWRVQGQIDATAAQIAALKHQAQAAKDAAGSLRSRQAAAAAARTQYQLVAPGQSLVQILPGASSNANAAHQGDPGFAPLVSPASVSPLADPSTAVSPVHPTGFLSRLVRTLEFWR